MESSLTPSDSNPEDQPKDKEQKQIIAKVLVKGEPGSSLSEVHEVITSEELQNQCENPIFLSMFEKVKDLNKDIQEGEQRIMWIDVREKCPEISAEQA